MPTITVYLLAAFCRANARPTFLLVIESLVGLHKELCRHCQSERRQRYRLCQPTKNCGFFGYFIFNCKLMTAYCQLLFWLICRNPYAKKTRPNGRATKVEPDWGCRFRRPAKGRERAYAGLQRIHKKALLTITRIFLLKTERNFFYMIKDYTEDMSKLCREKDDKADDKPTNGQTKNVKPNKNTI